jgi:hypothetical protein
MVMSMRRPPKRIQDSGIKIPKLSVSNVSLILSSFPPWLYTMPDPRDREEDTSQTLPEVLQALRSNEDDAIHCP